MPVVGCVEQRTANLQDCIMIWRNIRRHVQCLGGVGTVTAVVTAVAVVMAVAAEAALAVAAEVVLAVAAEAALAVAAEVVLAIKKVAARRLIQGRELKDLIGIEDLH
jgi:hypothetical protein